MGERRAAGCTKTRVASRRALNCDVAAKAYLGGFAKRLEKRGESGVHRRIAGYSRSASTNVEGIPMDDDLSAMSREELIAEARKLREGIRKHRDSTGQDLCWHHPALWGLLPEKTDPLPTVPDWPHFLQGCIRYRESLDAQAPRT